MLDRLKALANTAAKAASSAATSVGDLNGDGVIDAKDVQLAAQWTSQAAGTLADETQRLGKEVVRSDLTRDAAAGAAIGAVVAIPLPLLGPLAGAVVGAGLGIYKNVTRKSASLSAPAAPRVDVHAELLKLADLRDKGLLTATEFESQKRKLLAG